MAILISYVCIPKSWSLPTLKENFKNPPMVGSIGQAGHIDLIVVAVARGIL